jgi:hypothetical protein
MMLESPQLAQYLGHIPTHWWGQYFHGLHDSVGVDEETSSNVKAFYIIVNTVERAYLASRVGYHRIRDAAFHHLGELDFLPDLVGEIAVHADGYNVDSQFLEFGVLDGNCRQFRRSDAGEISRVKAKHHPLSPEVTKGNFFGGAFVKRLSGEIRGFSSH